jgi:hypothetical protein
LNILFITPSVDSLGQQWAYWAIYSRNGETPLVLDAMSIDMKDFRTFTCGRKNFALYKTLLHILGTESVLFEAVCVIDSDVDANLPLITDHLRVNFADKTLGVVSGMRRFTSAKTLPSAVRLVWQHYAQWVMWWGHIPWGGCLAFRTELCSTFLCRWQNSLFDDTMAAGIAEASGYRFRHDRKLVLDDDGTWTRWRDLLNFVQRQLVDVRLYGSWPAVWVSSAALLYFVYLQVAELPLQLVLGMYIGVFVGLGRGWRTIPALVLVQVVHILSVPAAQVAKSIRWADLKYEIRFFKNP